MKREEDLVRRPRIKCVTYGGRVGWFLRKHFSWITSAAYLKWQYAIRKKLFIEYEDLFDALAKKGEYLQPCLISIETLNRCNSTCEFCPANRNSDKRPYRKMDEELFKKIISDLKDWNYCGYLNLYVNNEPFMDSRIEDWYLYAKKQLPEAKMLLYTNGTLLSKERFSKVIPVIEKCIINNYSESLALHQNLKDLYGFVKDHKEYWGKDITIQIRYIKEILTNRAGEAPNNKKQYQNHMMCVMPYTDMTIYPDGIVGLCCSDALEKTNYGNVNNTSMKEIWESDTYRKLRKVVGKDRSKYPFCKGCDFVDAGIRNDFMNSKIKQRKRDSYDNEEII